MEYHLLAKKGSYAKFVILVGDPGRAQLIARDYLTNPKAVNTNRGLVGFTGLYQNLRLSIQTTGIGTPSTAIVMEELIHLGVQTFLRIGSTCSVSDIEEDIISARSVYGFDGTTKKLHRGHESRLWADREFLKLIKKTGESENIKVFFGDVATGDLFYNPNMTSDIGRWRAKAISCIDMETSVIYSIAQRTGKVAGSILAVSDSFTKVAGGGFRYTKKSERSFNSSLTRAIKVGLKSIQALSRSYN